MMTKKNSATLFIFLCSIQQLPAYESVYCLVEYAKDLPEHAPSDNNDWRKPSFKKMFEATKPNYFAQLLRKYNIITDPFWSIVIFKDLLKEALEKGPYFKDIPAIPLPVTPGAKIYVWGSLHGAVHSIGRSLNELRKKKVLSGTFKVLQENTYFIFTGNVIDGTPYSMETVSAVLSLLVRNPGKVFYLQGNHERNNNWINYSLNQEFEYKSHGFSVNNMPLKDAFKKLTPMLPEAVYVYDVNDPSKVIRICQFEKSDLSFDEKQFLSDILPENNSKQKPKVISSISSEHIVHYESHPGLVSVGQDEGASLWSVYSGPTTVAQQFHNFFHDAFVILQIAQPLRQSTLTLVNHDIRAKDKKFVYNTPLTILSGKEKSEQEVSEVEKELNIGSSMSLERGVTWLGQNAKLGMNLRVHEANQKQTIPGLHLTTTVLNDNYAPYLARKNIIQLTQEGTDIILLPVGTPTIDSYHDFIKENKLLVLFPITGAHQIRKPSMKGIVHFRASYDDEIKVLINYLVSEHSAKNFVFFYQNDGFGQSSVKSAHEALKQNNITTWTDLPYARAAVNFDDHVKKFKEVQPDAVGFFSAAGSTQEFIRQLGIDSLANTKLFGISFINSNRFRKFLEKIGLKMVFSNVVPNPSTSELELVKEYRNLVNEYHLSYDVYTLEGYIGASLLIDAIKKITGPITKDKIREQFESLKDYKFKGLTLTFNPEKRDLSQNVWIEVSPDKEWIEIKPKSKEQEKKVV